MQKSAVLSKFALARGPWKTFDPFLFCVYHNDQYPEGTDSMGPKKALLQNRQIGSDFSYIDGWSMYHGDDIPGFPQHPHRGFETITVTRKGLVDHSDSMGATARYGDGDTQWMTAGKGIQHAEMFPLVNKEKPNTLELFQIWLNLPQAKKMVDPYFTMFWGSQTPTVTVPDASGKQTSIKVVAGSCNGTTALAPPPDSFASNPKAKVVVWVITIPAGGVFTLKAEPGSTQDNLNRAVYFFQGSDVLIGSQQLKPMEGVKLDPTIDVDIKCSSSGPSEVLLLQGAPIGEKVVQYGPFVMNTQEEISQAYSDYRRTQFGGWPWKSADPAHSPTAKRFAKHTSGVVEEGA